MNKASEIRKLEEEIELCPATSYHQREPAQPPDAEATEGGTTKWKPLTDVQFFRIKGGVEGLARQLRGFTHGSMLHETAQLIATVDSLRARLEAAETCEKALAQWSTVFRDHFGPEGDDLAIADKGVQDLRAELSMAQSDKEAAEQERDALREALGIAQQWLDELREEFRRGALEDRAHRGGYLSNKNVEVEVQARAALAPKEATK